MSNIIIKKGAKILNFLLVFVCISNVCYSQEWKNDLRTKFLNNDTVIMEINIRSFNSKDIDGDGFIQTEKGEIRGNFLNAINRLDELKSLGVNAIHILPITPVGKLKALGTAGSLYSASSFSSVNPELADLSSKLDVNSQAKEFIKAAHEKNIRVIIDVPACASYDLYISRPELFVKGKLDEPVLPSDWTDVRLLNSGDENFINPDVYNLYKDFVDLVIELGSDGIRADVAHSKSANFWKELIDYSRQKDPEFLWIAESSDSWSESISPYAVFTPYDKLLESGFDGYYGSFFNIKDWKNSHDLYNQISNTLKTLKEFETKKSVIGSFTNHDQVSPILINGPELSDMIIWLNATLPLNSYFVDGFQTGDDYVYLNGNKKSKTSNTDDYTYFTHHGQIDIFNYSRKPGGKNMFLKNDFILGNNVKSSILEVLNNGKFTPIKINNDKIFAYSYSYNKKTVLTVGNLDFKNEQKASFHIPRNAKNLNMIPIKITNMPEVKKGKFNSVLNPGEIIVLIFK